MRRIVLAALLASLSLTVSAEDPAKPHLFDRFKALAGTWSGEGLDGNSMPGVTVTYHVTSGGHAVEEVLFPGTPHEMRTVFARDGEDVVLVHFCASGNHPKMRGRADADGSIAFEFESAVNFDPSIAGHMHNTRFAFAGDNELTAKWQFWSDGKPTGDVANFHLKRTMSTATGTTTH